MGYFVLEMRASMTLPLLPCPGNSTPSRPSWMVMLLWSSLCGLCALPTPGNGIGDACRSDYDGDGVPDSQDACPLSGRVSNSTFVTLLNISIPVSSRAASTWHVNDMVSLHLISSRLGLWCCAHLLHTPLRMQSLQINHLFLWQFVHTWPTSIDSCLQLIYPNILLLFYSCCSFSSFD